MHPSIMSFENVRQCHGVRVESVAVVEQCCLARGGRDCGS